MRTLIVAVAALLAVGCVQEASDPCVPPTGDGVVAGVETRTVVNVELAPLVGTCEVPLAPNCLLSASFVEGMCGFVVEIDCGTHRGAAATSWDGHQGTGRIDFEGDCSASYTVRVADGAHANVDGDDTNSRWVTE